MTAAEFVMAMSAMLKSAMLEAAFVAVAAKIALTVAIVLRDTFDVSRRRGRSSGRHGGNGSTERNRQRGKFQGLFQIQHFNLLKCVLHIGEIGTPAPVA
jgi:hypothetical protein